MSYDIIRMVDSETLDRDERMDAAIRARPFNFLRFIAGIKISKSSVRRRSNAVTPSSTTVKEIGYFSSSLRHRREVVIDPSTKRPLKVCVRLSRFREFNLSPIIIKPFAPDKLIEKIDHWVAQSANEVPEERLILLADDSQTVRDLNKYILEDSGFTVKAYETGLKLVADLDNQNPCLIILDVQMPKLGGYETCE